MATQLYVRTPAGALLASYSGFVRCEYVRAVNQTGWLQVDFSPAAVNTGFFGMDTRLEVWRQLPGLPPYLDGETVFFVRRWGYMIDSVGRELFRVYAQDANCLLDSRIVAYSAETAYAKKSGTADDIARAIVRENLGASATDAARSLASYLTVQADTSAAQATSMAFSRRVVSDVLRDLAQSSYNLGTYMAFDVVYTSPTMLEFRCYTGQRGTDHGATGQQIVTISRERLNLEEPATFEDHENEKNYIYAGGQGVNSNRLVGTASRAGAIGLSPFNRREGWVDARNVDSSSDLTIEAEAAVYDNRYRETLTGRILDVFGATDGINYRWGDIVYAEYRGQGFDAHIDAMHVILEGGRETRENYINGEAVD